MSERERERSPPPFQRPPAYAQSYARSHASSSSAPSAPASKHLGSTLTASQGLPIFEKNFYIEHPVVAARSEQEVEEYRQQNQVTAL